MVDIDSQQGRALKLKSIKLLHAIKLYDAPQIEALLDDSFPIETPVTDTNLPALSAACIYVFEPQHIQIFSAILKRGASVLSADVMGRTPLHIAAVSGNPLAVQVLTQQPGIKLNAFTSSVETPVHLAVRSGCVKTVATVLKVGCYPFYYNGMGQSTLDLVDLLFPGSGMRAVIQQVIEQYKQQVPKE